MFVEYFDDNDNCRIENRIRFRWTLTERKILYIMWLIDCDEYDENELFAYRDDDWDDEIENELSENKIEIWLEQRL